MNAQTNINPFVGLRPFESNEDFLFFGREQQILELLQRLHKYHFVAVIGSSGSGKSSLIKAGLIPALEAGYLVNKRDRWLTAVMKPGQDPLYNLASCILGQIKTPNELAASELVDKINEEGVDVLLDIMKPSWQQKVNLFLVVDQFEELFRFSLDQKSAKNKDEAIDFVNIMLELSQQQELPVYVVITMRSDFIGDCTQFFGFPEALNQSQYLVPRLTRTQLETAIEGPIGLFKSRISGGLTARLLNDAQTIKDELPLLQHALMRTWDHKMNKDGNGELDIGDYENIGGVEKALSNHADEALGGMSENDLQLTKKIFQALTTIDDNGRKIRRPVSLGALQEITGANKEQLLGIINRFIEGNRSFLIINKSNEESSWLIDISHESLIRQWNTLSVWVDEETESGKTYTRLTESASLFEAKKKDLLIGNELQQMLIWYYSFKPGAEWAAQYNSNYEQNIQYLKESEKASKRARNKGKAILGGVIILTIAVIFALAVAYRSASRAEQNALASTRLANIQKEANANQLARSYWVNSQTARAENKSTESLQYMAEAVELSKDTNLTRNLLMDAESMLPISLLQNIFQTEDYFSNAAFSPDGKRVLTPGLHHTAQIWDAASGKQIGPSLKHDNIVRFVTFSPDGKQILTISGNSVLGAPVLQFWNAETWKATENLAGDNGAEKAVFSPDGRQFLTTDLNGAAQLWDVALGRKVGPPMKHDDNVYSAIFSPDGKWILTAGNMEARLWKAGTGKQAGPSMKHDGSVNTAVFSRDGRRILTASKDGTAQLWDTRTCRKVGPPMNHESGVNSAFFNDSGSQIVTCGFDKTVRLWEAGTGRQIGTSMKYDAYVNSAVFSPGGKQILTANSDKTARIWDIGTEKQVAVYARHNAVISNAIFDSGGTHFVTTSWDKTVRLWELYREQNNEKTIGLVSPITKAIYRKDGKEFLTTSPDSTIHFWDAQTGFAVGPIIKCKAIIYSAVFSDDGKHILITAKDSTARLYDVNTGSQVGSAMNHNADVYRGVFSPDHKMILTSSIDGTARLWEAATGRQLGSSMKHQMDVYSAVFSPDGKLILTVSRDGTVTVWNTATQKQTGSVLKYENAVYSAIFSPDGKKVLVNVQDSTVRVIEVGEGLQEKAIIKLDADIFKATFSPDGKQILTISSDRTVRIWDATTGAQLGPSLNHDLEIASAVFSADGKRILTASWDSTVKISEAGTGQQIGPSLWHSSSVVGAAFGTDERQILALTKNGIVHLWEAAGDLDLSPALFSLQVRVVTGIQFNRETNDVHTIPINKWNEMKTQWLTQAAGHYKTCKYPKYNFWKRFYPEEAKKIRPN